MKKILVLFWMLLYPEFASAILTGPTTSDNGRFTVRSIQGAGSSFFRPIIRIAEVSSTGAVLNHWPQSSVDIVKTTSGIYYFAEQWCYNYPPTVRTCTTLSTHQVHVNIATAPIALEPDSLSDQLNYQYRLRSADLDRNGRVDIVVERLSAGSPDGSMQSYIVFNNTNGTISTVSLNSSIYAAAARVAPLNNTLNLMLTDMNADGYPDHVIGRVNAVMGTHLQPELAVFAPGTETNKLQPAGSRQIDDTFKSFIAEIGYWMHNENYFSDNVSSIVTPVYRLGVVCSIGFSGSSGSTTGETNWGDIGFTSSGRVCSLRWVFVGYSVRLYGINFSALSVAYYLNRIPDGGDISADDMWRISQIARGVIGVHLFGYDADGERHETNHEGINEATRIRNSVISWLKSVMSATPILNTPRGPDRVHNYTEMTTICLSSMSWCTIENIACWGRHYHAPNKSGGYDTPAVDSGKYYLDTLGFRDPIQTAVGGILGEHAVANITLPGHVLHDPEAAGWGRCPRPPPMGEPAQKAEALVCNQVYRKPRAAQAEEGPVIEMFTHGYGANFFKNFNQKMGPIIFSVLDYSMKHAILEKSDHLCPSR